MGELIIAHGQDMNNVVRSTGLPKKCRKYIREAIKTNLANIDARDPSTFPLFLDKLEFRVLAHFFTTFYKKYTKTTNAAGDETVVPVQAGDTPDNLIYVRLHKSSYDGVTSSLANLYRDCGIPRDINPTVKLLWESLSNYKKGTTRVGAKQRKELGLRLTEGKDPLPFAAYQYLAEILHQSNDPDHIAAHLFLLLEWNMISRADSVIGSNIELCGMRNDALVFDLGPTKTDQEGKQNIDHPFHIYSCPENPSICTVLAMCKHLLHRPQILKGQCQLFEGSNQYDHYCSIFRKIVNDSRYRQGFIDRGLDPKYFGTHSLRKGAVTHVSSGITSSPPIASICIRANWKMPGVMNRYIKYESAGDQYVGRCVSGRNRLGKRFAESIPYFDFSEQPAIVKEQMMREQDIWIKQRMSEAGAINDGVFCLFKTCLASFIFHWDWLRSTIHRDSPLRSTIFWSEKEQFPHANNVTTCFPWTQTADTPQFTGIPIDVLYLAKIEELNKRIADMESGLKADNDRVIDSIKAHVDQALDDRAVGGEGYGVARSIDAKLDKLIEQFSMESNNRIANSTSANNVGDDDSVAGFLEEEIVEFTFEEVQEIQEQARDAAAKERSKQLLENRKQNGIVVGVHNGIITPLLPTWRYPERMTLQQMISLWLVGIRTEHVPPFRFIFPKQVRHFDKDAKRFHDMRACMKIIERIAVRKGVWRPPNFAGEFWNGVTVTKLWDGISIEILPHLRTVTKSDGKADSYHKSKPFCLAWRTAFKKLRQGLNVTV
jgi:hypothetical protein